MDPLFEHVDTQKLIPLAKGIDSGPDVPNTLLDDPLIMLAVRTTVARYLVFSGVPMPLDFIAGDEVLVAQLVVERPLALEKVEPDNIGALLSARGIEPQQGHRYLTQMVGWRWNLEILARYWMPLWARACEAILPLDYEGELPEIELGMLIRVIEWQRQAHQGIIERYPLVGQAIGEFSRTAVAHLAKNFKATPELANPVMEAWAEKSPGRDLDWWWGAIEYMVGHQPDVLGRHLH